LQPRSDGRPIAVEDWDTLAWESGILKLELGSIVAAGVRAGALHVDADKAICLTPKAAAWWRVVCKRMIGDNLRRRVAIMRTARPHSMSAQK
jgi:hypothetical protein